MVIQEPGVEEGKNLRSLMRSSRVLSRRLALVFAGHITSASVREVPFTVSDEEYFVVLCAHCMQHTPGMEVTLHPYFLKK